MKTAAGVVFFFMLSVVVFAYPKEWDSYTSTTTDTFIKKAAVAIAVHESASGTSPRAVRDHNLHGLARVGKYMKFESDAESFKEVIRRLQEDPKYRKWRQYEDVDSRLYSIAVVYCGGDSGQWYRCVRAVFRKLD